jgi:hypothetical protein
MGKTMCLVVSQIAPNQFHCFDLTAEDVVKLQSICKAIDSDVIRDPSAQTLVDTCNLMDAVKPSTR